MAHRKLRNQRDFGGGGNPATEIFGCDANGGYGLNQAI